MPTVGAEADKMDAQTSAAQPLALALLGVSVALLAYTLLRSFLRRGVALREIETLGSVGETSTAAREEGSTSSTRFENEEERRLGAAAQGEAVELPKYRATVRAKVSQLALTVTLCLGLSTAQMAWIAVSHPESPLRIAEHASRSALWILLLSLLLRRSSVPAYRLAIALTLASFLAFFTQVLTLLVASDFAIFPSTAQVGHARRFSARGAHHPAAVASADPFASLPFGVQAPWLGHVLHAYADAAPWALIGTVGLQIVSCGLALLAFILAGTLPVGPPRVYRASPRGDAAPMIGMGPQGSEALLPALTHRYMLPLIRLAKRNGALEAQDLPYLHAELRAITLFADLRAAWAAQRARTSKPRARHLLFALVSTMRRELIVFFLVAWVDAVMFYAPSFYVNRFVSVLEAQAQTGGPRDQRTGATWALAAFATGIFQNLLFNALMTMTLSNMSAKLKQQLNALLFAKTLRRQEIVSAASAKKRAEAENSSGEAADGAGRKKKTTAKADEEEEEEEEEGSQRFQSKAAVMTLIGNDIERVSNMARYIWTLGVAPTEIVVGFTFVFLLLGWGALVGLASALLLVPVFHQTAKLTGKFQEKLMNARDERVTFLNEAIEAIRMIKFSAWEAKVMNRILLSRRRELKELRKVFWCETANEALTSFSPILVIIVALGWSILVDGHKLTPSVAFTAVAVLNELRFALTELPSLIESVIELWVSFGRIVAFLELPEVQLPHDEQAEVIKDVKIQNATISWPVHAEEPEEAGKRNTNGGATASAPESDSDPSAATVAPAADAFKLKDITTAFETGKVNLICGKVGSGKSMLLLALLGELSIDKGSIICPRSHPNALGGQLTAPDFIRPDEWIRDDLVAYIPQTAWLVNASLRDNITWGLPMDEKRYRDTLAACALLPDLAVLEDGDLTDIGEKGIGLSGGQKTRVALARCVYSRARLLLLDSPLSNVDANTASHIHEELLKGPLLSDRTVLLVSHQVAMLAPTAAKVIMLEDGRVKYDGSAKSFLGSDHYAGLLEDHEDADAAERTSPEQDAAGGSVSSSGAVTPVSSAEATSATTPATSRPPSVKEVEEANQSQGTGVLRQVRKAMSEEAKARGAVSAHTYTSWIRAAGGWWYMGFVLFSFLLLGAWDIVPGLWLRALSADAASPTTRHSSLFWVCGYAALLSTTSVIKAITYVVMYTVSLRASRSLFVDMLGSVFRADMRTHDTIPKGRFINRFSSDMEANDQGLPSFFAAVTSLFLTFLFGLLAAAFSGGGGLVFMIFVLAPVVYYTGSLYRIATRDLRRLEAISKSPVVTSFSDLLSGAVVVRAFGSSGRMMSDLLSKSDDNTRFVWLLSQTSRWMVCVYQLCSSSVILAGYLALLFNPYIDAATAGFAASFLTSTDFFLSFALMDLSMFEQKAVSTERIIEYQELPQEPPAHVATGPPASWPSEGSVEIKELSIKYAPELPTILKGITLDIPARAKVGIVGKTGCGKSTLASCFFRFVEPTSGHIKIDGVDISSVGLEDLRSRITIVPQDPVILSGTLREAIDPFYDFSDEQVKDALEKVRLVPSEAEAAAKSPFADLAYKISEGGSNLSGGERQLICLARALLGSCKLVFFDEASSALDSETDEAIAKTIREALVNSTVVTIAHRLRTIADFDYILVMDKGQVLEFDKPIKLIDDPDSRFHKLAKATGKAEFRELREMALQASSS